MKININFIDHYLLTLYQMIDEMQPKIYIHIELVSFIIEFI
ncbi:MAG: hypothetical protein K0R21_1234 [Anaerocolumna sp.]|jgi:hypothetical protein|nr:hypothetical protein [Anaerocolumna sp.]